MSLPVHHLNILVQDLDKAAQAFSTLLQQVPIFEALPLRGAHSARFRCGELYLVLVSPDDEKSVLHPLLTERGEGVFLLSFGVESIDATLRQLANEGEVTALSEPRKGLADWQVQDIETGYGLPLILQLCESSASVSK